MKILLAADGSKFTKKALAFLVTHEELLAQNGELHVLFVHPNFPPRVRSFVLRDVLADYQSDEANKVLAPITKFLQRHAVKFQVEWVIGDAGDEIIKAAKREKVHLIMLGTHGKGLLGRVLLGSVAQRVVAGCDVPILLVK